MKEVVIDLTDLEAEYFLRHERGQGQQDALREIARLLSLYNSGRLPLTMMQMRLAVLYNAAHARSDEPQFAGAKEVYADFLRQLDRKGR